MRISSCVSSTFAVYKGVEFQVLWSFFFRGIDLISCGYTESLKEMRVEFNGIYHVSGTEAVHSNQHPY